MIHDSEGILSAKGGPQKLASNTILPAETEPMRTLSEPVIQTCIGFANGGGGPPLAFCCTLAFKNIAPTRRIASIAWLFSKLSSSQNPLTQAFCLQMGSGGPPPPPPPSALSRTSSLYHPGSNNTAHVPTYPPDFLLSNPSASRVRDFCGAASAT